ncbi:replicative DNA helicase [Bradyrhizobium oligotrophicum]|uniref:replicative DNA helicase n=1 Tax=Bradyrhizobium oligotrophicum TaxID=44255 RepID=UPI003EBF237F
MPQDIQIEQALLGELIVNKGSNFDVVLSLVNAGDLHEPIHQRLFAELAAAYKRDGLITLDLARAILGTSGDAVICEGMTAKQYVARLASEAVSIREAPAYARQIREFANLRRLLETAEAMIASVRANAPALDISREAMAAMDGIDEAPSSARSVSIGEASREAIEEMQWSMQHPGKLLGLTTGLSRLDDMTGGLERGNLIILAGRPGMGKSAVACCLAEASAVAGEAVLIFSLEMQPSAIASRMLAKRVAERGGRGASYSDMRRGRLSYQAAEAFIDAQRFLDPLPIEIDPRAGITAAQVAERSRKHRRKLERQGKRLALVIVDHVHILAAAGNRYEAITEASGLLKRLAKELDCPVVAAAQLSRKVEDRDDKRPNMADLRESGALEQDADLILFLYRESYYLRSRCDDPEADRKRLARLSQVQDRIEVIVGKQRNGETGTVDAYCEIESNLICDGGDR